MTFAANIFLILRRDRGSRYQSFSTYWKFSSKKYSASQEVQEFRNYVLLMKIFLADLHKQCGNSNKVYLRINKTSCSENFLSDQRKFILRFL